MKVKGLLVAGALFAATVVGANAHAARDYIAIVGSSTVYPFATVVAEQFGKTTDFKTPKIESTGSGGGLKLFCAGLGPDHPDITNASRAIKASEQKTCAENGITEIVEVKVGYDGIVLANSKQAGQLDLSRKDVFLAWWERGRIICQWNCDLILRQSNDPRAVSETFLFFSLIP
jgi:phosphate transport system substrate-binding protein